MTPTVDREVTNTALLREIQDFQIDPHQTGYRLPMLGDWSALSSTRAETEHGVMIAEFQWPGSFVPAIVDEYAMSLSDYLSRDWAIEDWVDEVDDEPMVLPAPYSRRVTMRVREVFYGVPSSIAFED